MSATEGRSRRRAGADVANKDAEVAKEVEVDAENGQEEAAAPVAAPTRRLVNRRPATSTDDEDDAPAEEAKPVPKAGPKKVGLPRGGVQSAPAKRPALQRFSAIEEGTSRPKNVDPIDDQLETLKSNGKGLVKDVIAKLKTEINHDGGTGGSLYAAIKQLNETLTHINTFKYGSHIILKANADLIRVLISTDLSFGDLYKKTGDKIVKTDEQFFPSSLEGFLTDEEGIVDDAYISRDCLTDLAALILENNADKVTKQGKTGAATRQHYSLHSSVRSLFKEFVSARSGTKSAPIDLGMINVATLTKLLLDNTRPLDQEKAHSKDAKSFEDICKTVDSDAEAVDLVRNGPAKLKKQEESAAKKAAAAASK